MRQPRRRKEGMSHSISCTDEEWEMIGAGAARAKMGASAWFAWCCLNVNPMPSRTIPVALDERQQRNAARAIERLAGKLRDSPESLARFEDNVRSVLRERIRAMTRQNRVCEARARLCEVFGEKHAAWIENWAQKPRRRKGDADEGHMDQ